MCNIANLEGLLENAVCLVVVQFILALVVWMVSFFTKPFMWFIMVFVLTLSCCGMFVVRQFNNSSHNAYKKLLPLGAFAMVVFTILPTLGLLFVIWSNGFKDVIFEGIMTVFQLLFLAYWIAVYFVSDHRVKTEFPPSSIQIKKSTGCSELIQKIMKKGQALNMEVKKEQPVFDDSKLP